VPIKVINSVTKKSKQLLRLPNYDYPPTIDWQKNHIAIESTGNNFCSALRQISRTYQLLGSNCSHFYVYSRDSRPKLRLYVSEYNGASINVSPDGTRFSFDLNENSFTLYEITGYRAPGPEDMDEDEAEDEDEEVTEMDRWFQGSNIDGNRFSKKLSTITVINNKKPQSTIGQTEGDEGSTR
jgi:dipeptidyl aminopeptidase/acylaminoacyl peptidase